MLLAVALAKAAPTQPQPGGDLLQTPQDQKARVLLVDDDPEVRNVCREALERSGHQVTAADTGAAALEALRQTDFDVGVLDIVLPDLSGLDLLPAMHERNADTVVILITGFASLETAMGAVRLGAYDYLRKPFTARDLVRTVERGLEGQALKRRNRQLLEQLRLANQELLEQQDRLRDRMRLANGEVQAFSDLGKRLCEEREPVGTLRDILEAGLQLTKARAAAAYKVDASAGLLTGLLGVGLARRDVTDARVPLGEGLLGEVAAGGVARIENDLLAGPVADDDYLGFLGVQSVLASPAVCERAVRGVLAFFDGEAGDFTERNLNLIAVLAGQAARVLRVLEQDAQQAPSRAAEDGFVNLSDLLGGT